MASNRYWRRPDAPLVVEGKLWVNVMRGSVTVGDAELDAALREWLRCEYASVFMAGDGPRVRLTVECVEPETYA